jgi:flagellum-specific ATP synthase
MNEPIADAVRSILDGHVVLSRHLAHAGHYPAVDVLQSVSRLVGEIVSPEVRQAGMQLRKLMAAYRDKEDLIAIGAYQPGTDPVVDEAVSKRVAIEAFLQQTVDDVSDAEMADAQLLALAGVVAATPVIDMDGPVVEPPPAPVGGESAIPPLHLSV